jgi:uracil-DNA glycosylase family 4
MTAIEELQNQVIACTRCPRLATYIREVAVEKRRQFRDEPYWGRPVPSFGDPAARLLIVGLAPAAHGGNRTGRAFTGDRSGDLLYKTLFQTGFANQPVGRSADDGLRLQGAWISQIAHCAPPLNKPLPEEITNCRYWLRNELRLLWPTLRVVVVLGKIAFDGYLATLKETHEVNARMLFAHNRLNITGEHHPILLSSYHPSQQNTSTGRLTESMFQEIFERAAAV